MAVNPELVSQCPHDRCAAPVLEVRLGSKLERKLLDVERLPWPDGGRIKLVLTLLTAGEPPIARRLMHAGQAFGSGGLYRLHEETCKVAQKHKRQKATSS